MQVLLFFGDRGQIVANHHRIQSRNRICQMVKEREPDAGKFSNMP